MRRERRQLLLAIPVIVLAPVLWALLVLLWVWSLTAARAYDDGDLAGAGASWDRQRSLTPLWPEPWKAPYNQGTGRRAGGEYVDAVEPLRTALARVTAGTPDEEGGLLGAYPRSPVPLPNQRSIRDSRNGKTTCIIPADATYGAREIGPYTEIRELEVASRSTGEPGNTPGGEGQSGFIRRSTRSAQRLNASPTG